MAEATIVDAAFPADLEIVRKHVEPESRVLEYGAIPLVMTGALAALDYDVRAVDLRPERFASAITDLGLDYQLVTDYTSMVVLADEAFESHGIRRRNRDRARPECHGPWPI